MKIKEEAEIQNEIMRVIAECKRHFMSVTYCTKRRTDLLNGCKSALSRLYPKHIGLINSIDW